MSADESAESVRAGSASDRGLAARTTPAATAVPDTVALAGPLADQELTWAKCDFSQAGIRSEATRTALENDPDTLCTTVTVPRDWYDPDPESTFDIAISRTASSATGTPDYEGAILINPGGPGASGLAWGPAMKLRSAELWESYDLIGFDPRGVALSRNGLRCPGTSFAAACSAVPDVALINTDQTTYDLDFIRAVLDLDTINYIGYSYGTWLGTWFGNTFGPNIDRMLLDSAVDTTQPTLQHAWDGPQQAAKQQRVQDFILPWMARNSAEINSRFGLNIPSDLAEVEQALLRGTQDRYVRNPPSPERGRYGVDGILAVITLTCEVSMGGTQADYGRWAVICLGDLVSQGATSETVVAEPTYRPSDNELASRELGNAFMLQVFLQAISTDPRIPAVDAWITPSGPPRGIGDLTASPVAANEPAEDEGPDAYNALNAVRCGDGLWNQDPAYYNDRARDMIAGDAAWGLVIRDNACIGYTTELSMPPVSTVPGRKNPFPESLVIQSEFDTRTAFELGVVPANALPNTTGVFVDNESVHGLFPYATSCVDSPVLRLFLEDRRQQQNVVCQAKPLPLERQAVEVGGVIRKDGSKTPVPARVGAESAVPFADTTLSPSEERRAHHHRAARRGGHHHRRPGTRPARRAGRRGRPGRGRRPARVRGIQHRITRGRRRRRGLSPRRLPVTPRSAAP